MDCTEVEKYAIVVTGVIAVAMILGITGTFYA